ncbi:MAG: hypothetical protein HUU35_12575, partial [Armatimonadetes bacterium]|nr:hypothetical protein [Armatimonadota bacterium]
MLAFCLSLLLAAEPPQVLFSAPLTGGPDAVHAVGVATGIVHHDGAGREAWSIRGEHDVISYLAQGNLDKRRGTIAFAFKAGWQPGDRANRILLADERNFDDKADNALRFWKWEDRTLRLDLRAVGDRYLTVPLAPLEDGDWHHLAAAWDCEAGTAIYVDGKRVGARESRWEPLPAKWLNLGHGRGCEPGLGDYRNLVVYDRALGEAEVAELAAGR